MKSKDQKYFEAISRNIHTMLEQKQKLYEATKKKVHKENYDPKMANQEISFANSLYSNCVSVSAKVGMRKADINSFMNFDYLSFSAHNEIVREEFVKTALEFESLTYPMPFFSTKKANKS